MPTDEPKDDLPVAWQEQPVPKAVLNLEDMRRLNEHAEKAMRRRMIGFVLAVTLSSVVIGGIAAIFSGTLLKIGAVALIAGLVVLAAEVARHWRKAPAPEVSSIDYQRALLRHRMEFHRKRLWLRVVILAPGGVLFFLGFAVARPQLAPIIAIELATFALAMILIVPANRRAAARIEKEIAELERLRNA